MFAQLAVLFALVFAPADDLSLSGIVFDPNAATAGGVHVRVEHTVDRRRWDATTGPDGKFQFGQLAIGNYRVTVQREGYFEASTEVRLESSKTIEFTLAPAETLKQEIDVIARPTPINTDSVSPQNTVNDEVIQNIPYTGRRDFLNAVALMPGVIRDNSGQVHIQGSRADQVQYSLDGMNLTDAASGGLSSNIPMDAIESVDVDLSGYSAEFGKGSGGMVRVHSQFVGNDYRFTVTDFVPGINFKEKAVAEFSPRILFSGPVVQQKLWFMYSGSLRYVQTFVEDLPKPNNQQNQTITDQFLKLQWNLRESHVLTFNVLHNSEYFGNSGLSVVRPQETTTNLLRRNLTLGLSDRRTRGGLLLESLLQWSRRRDTDLAKGTSTLQIQPGLWQGNFFTDRRGRSERIHAAQTAAWQKGTRGVMHRFKIGAEFDNVDSDLWLPRRPFYILDDAGNVKSSVGFVGSDYANIGNQEYGAFMLDRMALTPKLEVEVGLRFDREHVVGRNNFAPRAAFSFLPLGTARSKLSGGLGIFYDNVSLTNLELPRLQRRYSYSYDSGVPWPVAPPVEAYVAERLRNPSGLHWNITWENEWAPRWVSRISYVQKTGRNQARLAAAFKPDGFDLEYNNSGTSSYHAVELTLDRPIRTNFRVLASYIYSDAKERPSLSLDFPDPGLEAVTTAPTAWNTRHRFVSWAYFPLPGAINASYSVEARSGFAYTATDEVNRAVEAYNTRALPAYFVTNVSVEKEIPMPFKKRIAFRVGVTNLFNRFNPRFVDANVTSPTFASLSGSSGRHFVGRLRIVKR